MTSAIRMIGDDLIEVTVASRDEARGLALALRTGEKFTEVVPALGVVTVQFDPLELTAGDAYQIINEATSKHAKAAAIVGERIVIPVRYGGETGPDLDHVAEAAGLSVEDFITLHTSRDYPVAMIGFTPGFAYLGELDPKIINARLDQPRPRVAAGSVGIIKGFSGIYPLPGPGGWPIVGQTEMTLFDAQADDPFLIHQGTLVRFEAVA